MIFGLDPSPALSEASQPARVRFFPGDLVGMVVAEFLQADAVVVPITCNDAIDRGPLKHILEPKTRIGSPFVIAGLEAARSKGRKAVCGWEPNGGFLTGSDIRREGRVLRALPTRDAMLPILSVLFFAMDQKLSLWELFDRLPKRFGRAGLLRNFSRAVGLKIVQQISPFGSDIVEVRFQAGDVRFLHAARAETALPESAKTTALQVRENLARFFTSALGFGQISKLDYTDGVRIGFENGDITHVRPSGNADELRIYAVADTPARADAIVQAGIAEPDGILRTLEAFLS
jgi:phosphomannomutase